MYLNDLKAGFSHAYVRAVAHAAGYFVQEAARDRDNEGVDLTLTWRDPSGVIRNPRLDVQLKATAAVPSGDPFTYNLDAKNHRELSVTNWQIPRILVVVYLPADQADWVVASEEQLALRRCGYWLSLAGQTPTTNQETQVVSIPRANRFHVALAQGDDGSREDWSDPMSAQLWVEQAVRVPSPGDIAAYLLQRGWLLEGKPERWAQYVLSGNGQTIEVPQRSDAGDYPRAVRTLMDDLARLEGRSPSALVRDVLATSVDTIRIGLAGAATRDGRIGVEAGFHVHEATRNLLLAAACSVVEPRLNYSKRKPDKAMGYLDHARFGQSELGGYVITIECTVAPALGQPPLAGADEIDPPFERRVSLMLAHGIESASAAARESAASAQVTPFRDRKSAGVSANLCDALADLFEFSQADALTAGVSFASRRPTRAGLGRPVTMTADAAPVFREAAARMREQEPLLGVRAEGMVVKLASGDASEGGEIVLRAEVEGVRRDLHVDLPPAPYAVAIQAHRDRSVVSCVGDLLQEGRGWRIRNVGEFQVVEGSTAG